MKNGFFYFILAKILKKMGYITIRDSAFSALLKRIHQVERKEDLSEAEWQGVGAYLNSGNPRLLELKEKYKKCLSYAAGHSLWKEEYIQTGINLRSFRADSVFLWQKQDMNFDIHYLLTAYYIQAIDINNLLGALTEDGMFGAYTLKIHDNLIVSRDLLDSISEIYFLAEKLDIFNRRGINILDIGAGYGRFAHRLYNALPGLGEIFCVDAVAESTFLCEFYMHYRKVQSKIHVVPLYEVENMLPGKRIDLAVNIHSFSECTCAAVDAWLQLLHKCRVHYLMIIPNANTRNQGGQRLLSYESDGTQRDLQPVLEKNGYSLVCREPKYKHPLLQQFGISPGYHYLFQLSG